MKIPKKIKRKLDRLPKKVWYKVDVDKTIAIEKMLMIVANLTSTVFMDDENKWKSLNSSILHEQTKKGKDNTRYYKYAIEGLKYHTDSTEPIIEVLKNDNGTETYKAGVASKKYRLTETFQNTNLVHYQLVTNDCRKQRIDYLTRQLSSCTKNTIARNLIAIYPEIGLPTNKEIQEKGRQLVKENYCTKKGKQLKILNNKSKAYFGDCSNISFVDENVRLFQYLTNSGYLVPHIGDLKSGGRVVDSFTLMPSWIRQMCTIGKEEIVELDFSALHPNIVMSHYGGQQKYLTHQMIANELEVDLKTIKIEHLSFFNKRPNEMKRSILYGYYSRTEPEMLKKLISDKILYHYKHTSRLMFKKEVEIMTECIARLNQEGIYAIYVYDALYVKKSQGIRTAEIMNQVILEKEVFTKVKKPLVENKFRGLIYKIECSITNEKYIGATTLTIESRIQDHFGKANGNSSMPLHVAMNEYGLESFTWEQIDTANNMNELAAKEKEYILKYETKESGLNGDTGGGFKKIVYQFGKDGVLIADYPSLDKAVESCGGNKKGISKACLGINNSYKGYYWSYLPGFKIPTDKRKKKINQYDLEGNLLASYDSAVQAEKNTSINKSSISKVCRGERKKTGGYLWKYCYDKR